MSKQKLYEPISRSEEVKPTKITKWAKEPSVTDLLNDLQMAKISQESNKVNIDQWNHIRDLTGNKKIAKKKGRSAMQIKTVRRTLEWRYPTISEPFHSTTKLFNIQPVTFEDEYAAKQNELLLNWQIRTKVNKVKFIDDLVHSVVDDGTAVVSVGWVQEIKKVKVDVPVWEYYTPENPEYEMYLQQALELKSQNPRGYEEGMPDEIKASVDFLEETGQVAEAVLKGHTSKMEDTVVQNFPTVEVIDPRNIYIDPTCNGDYEKALFMIHAFEISYADVMREKEKFKNINAIRWDGDSSSSTDGDVFSSRSESQENFKDKSRRKQTAYDYWGKYDIHGDGSLVDIRATWVGNTMIRMEENPFPFKKPPFAIATYIPVKRSVFGEADAALLEDTQDVMGAVYRGMLDLMARSANSQVGTPIDWLDSFNTDKFDQGENFKYNPTTISPRDAVVNFTYPEIPNSALQMINLMNQESEAMSAVKSFSGGINSNAFGNLATGARMATDATAKRDMSILRRTAQCVKSVGEMMAAMNGKYLSKAEVVRVTNREFIEVTLEDLQGNFDLEVDIATAEVDNEKAQNLSFMLQTATGALDPGITQQMMAEVLELQKMPYIAEKIRNFKHEPTEEEKELQQIELEMARLNLQKLKSEIEHNYARASKAKSEADITDLDYVEQETGTKHEREIEKGRVQAEANMELEVVKAGLNNTSNKANIPSKKTTSKVNSVDQLPMTAEERELWKRKNPALSLTSDRYDSSQDPSSNLSLQQL